MSLDHLYRITLDNAASTYYKIAKSVTNHKILIQVLVTNAASLLTNASLAEIIFI